MKTTQLWSALVLGAALTLSGAAQAQTEGSVQGEVEQTESGIAKRESVTVGGSASGFGMPGQIVLTNDFSGSLDLGFSPTVLNIDLQPAVDYFLQQNLSVGASALLGMNIGEGDDSLNFGLAARVGYSIPFQESVSLWPRAEFGFTRVEIPDALGSTTTDTVFGIEGYVPALLHLAPHFFLGAGPYLRANFSGGSDVVLGARFTVGGYF